MAFGVKPQELRAIETQVQQLKQLNEKLNQQIKALAKRRQPGQSSSRKIVFSANTT